MYKELGKSAAIRVMGVKTATPKWDQFVRTAPIDELRPQVEKFIGSAAPAFYRSTNLNKALKAMRESPDVERTALIHGLRERIKFETPRHVINSAKRRANRTTLDFARSVDTRAKSPLIDVAHGGVYPELESMLKHGPTGPVDYALGTTGTPEIYGAYVHRADDALAGRLPSYAKRRNEYAGGEPAILHAKFPRDLLTETGRIGGGEHAIPRSLWKYLQDPVIKKV